jgi:hypothetical protein
MGGPPDSNRNIRLYQVLAHLILPTHLPWRPVLSHHSNFSYDNHPLGNRVLPGHSFGVHSYLAIIRIATLENRQML